MHGIAVAREGISASGVDLKDTDISARTQGDISIAGGSLHQQWQGPGEQQVRDTAVPARKPSRCWRWAGSALGTAVAYPIGKAVGAQTYLSKLADIFHPHSNAQE